MLKTMDLKSTMKYGTFRQARRLERLHVERDMKLFNKQLKR
nr:MAG TPA: hypothetical protein [Caudoviricetes sp.]